MAEMTYQPTKEDFEFLTGRDITTDQNFASQSYWKGVAIHFLRDRRAMIGLGIVVVIIILAILGPILSPYGYRDIVSFTDETGKEVVAKGVSPQLGLGGDGLFADHMFLFGTDDLGRDLWTRTW